MEDPQCKTCDHFERTCKWLLAYTGEETECDWWPSRRDPAGAEEKGE